MAVSGPQSLCGDAIAVSFRDALDEPVQAQTTQIVSDSSRGELARLLSEQWSEVLAEIVVPKCALDNSRAFLQQPKRATGVPSACSRAASVAPCIQGGSSCSNTSTARSPFAWSSGRFL